MRYTYFMIKAFILSLCLITTLLFANEHKEHTHLSYELSLSLLQTIDDDAIVIGTGKKVIYVFLDPLCPHSRKFMSMISKDPKMISKYQYHLFLYSIPRMKSTDVVSSVYLSPTPAETLLQIMVEDKIQYEKGNATTQAKVDRIDTIANKMDVFKRPYIFIVN